MAVPPKLRSCVIALLVTLGYVSAAAAVGMVGFDASSETVPVFTIDTVSLTASPNIEISPFVNLCHQKLDAMSMFILSSLHDAILYHSTYDDDLSYDDDYVWEEFILQKYENGTDYRFIDESESLDEHPIVDGPQYWPIVNGPQYWPIVNGPQILAVR